MDILTFFLLFVAATLVGSFAYIIMLIFQAVRPVGMRRFVRALSQFVVDIVLAFSKLFQAQARQALTKEDIDTSNYFFFIRPTQEKNPGIDPFHMSRDQNGK